MAASTPPIFRQALSPRQQILSTPFALQAEKAHSADLAEFADIAAQLVEQFQQALNPPGTIITYAGAVDTDTGGLVEPVPGYLLCNGAVLDGTAEDGKYAALVAALNSTWGHGGNAGNPQIVNPPDLRGVFLRGWNGAATDGYADPDRNARVARRAGGNSSNSVGSFQLDEFKSHSHTFNRAHGTGGGGGNFRSLVVDEEIHSTPQQILLNSGGNETRGKNAYVAYLIKY